MENWYTDWYTYILQLHLFVGIPERSRIGIRREKKSSSVELLPIRLLLPMHHYNISICIPITYTVKYHHRKPSKPLPPKTSIYKWKFTSRYLCTYIAIVTFCMHVCYSIYYTKLFSCFCYWRYFFNFSFSFYFMKIEAYISWTQTQVKSLIKSYTHAIVDWIYLCMKWMCVCDGDDDHDEHDCLKLFEREKRICKQGCMLACRVKLKKEMYMWWRWSDRHPPPLHTTHTPIVAALSVAFISFVH